MHHPPHILITEYNSLLQLTLSAYGEKLDRPAVLVIIAQLSFRFSERSIWAEKTPQVLHVKTNQADKIVLALTDEASIHTHPHTQQVLSIYASVVWW